MAKDSSATWKQNLPISKSTKISWCGRGKKLACKLAFREKIGYFPEIRLCDSRQRVDLDMAQNDAKKHNKKIY
jgi:hypothetical protein